MILLRILGCFAAFCPWASAQLLSWEDEFQNHPNEVVIWARPPEKRSMSPTGKNLIIEPSDPSRMQSDAHLKEQPSLSLAPQSRVQATGFSIPRIRGHDLFRTEIFVEDLPLQDPYSSLPLAEDLDMRAFGQAELYQGASSWQVESTNLIGALRYRFSELGKNNLRGGLNVGDPHFKSAWMRADWGSEKGQKLRWAARIYGQGAQSDGRYRFYDDNGTPFDVSDDQVRIRLNNDLSMGQYLPLFYVAYQDWQWMNFARKAQSQRGISIGNLAEGGLTRQSSTSDFWISVLKWNLGPALSLSLRWMHTQDQRTMTDPNRAVLVTSDRSTFSSQSADPSLVAEWTGEVARARCRLSMMEQKVQITQGQRTAPSYQRKRPHQFCGAQVVWNEQWELDLKASRRQHINDFSQFQSLAQGRGESLALAYRFHPRIQTYLQWGSEQRLPSLLEEFGDRGLFEGNENLQPETILHREVGGVVKHVFWGDASLSLYSDEIDNKIITIPILAGRQRASNVPKVKVRGIDFAWGIKWQRLFVQNSVAWIDAAELSRNQVRQLPLVPAFALASLLEYELKPFKLRWLARYRGEVYKDLGHSRALGGGWLHDFSIDLPCREQICMGISINNLLDNMQASTWAPRHSQNHGKTSFSDVYAFPLPGRQLRFFVEAQLR